MNFKILLTSLIPSQRKKHISTFREEEMKKIYLKIEEKFESDEYISEEKRMEMTKLLEDLQSLQFEIDIFLQQKGNEGSKDLFQKISVFSENIEGVL